MFHAYIMIYKSSLKNIAIARKFQSKTIVRTIEVYIMCSKISNNSHFNKLCIIKPFIILRFYSTNMYLWWLYTLATTIYVLCNRHDNIIISYIYMYYHISSLI